MSGARRVFVLRAWCQAWRAWLWTNQPRKFTNWWLARDRGGAWAQLN